MSYILDALKRADAERGRGQVPGLNAQPLGGTQAAPARSGARWGWVVAGAVLVLLAAAAWWALRPVASGDGCRNAAACRRTCRTDPTGARCAAASRGVTRSVAPQPGAQPAPAPQHQPHRRPPTSSRTGTPRRIRPTRADRREEAGVGRRLCKSPLPRPHRQARPARLPATAPGARGDHAVASPPVAPTRRHKPASCASVVVAHAPPAPRRRRPVAAAVQVAPLLSELPESAKRGLPTLTITGAVASDNPAQRLLLVNGQVLPQGAMAAPEVLIEEIQARSATFTFRGTRFRIAF
jgi:general secretion pathway protein B